jgi:hypothetical protein
MEEPAPPPGFLSRAEEYRDAATIPRLLALRAEKLGRPRPPRPGAGRSRRSPAPPGRRRR